MSRVFVARQLPGPALARLGAEHDVEVWPERLPPPPEGLREHAEDADGILSLLTDRIDAGFIDACPKLVAISNYAVGYDNVDVDAATRRGAKRGASDAARRIGLRFDPLPAHAADPSPGRRARARADAANGDPHQHRARTHRRSHGAAASPDRGRDRGRRARRDRSRAAPA